MFTHRKITREKKTRQLINRNLRSGFTFLEVIISLLVFSVGSLAMLQAVNVSMEAQYRATQELIAGSLASALQAEIATKDFEEPAGGSCFPECGPEISEERTTAGGFAYDDVDDYGNLQQLEGDNPLSVGGFSMDGEYIGNGYTMPDCRGFTRSVKVEYVYYDHGLNVYKQREPYAITSTKRINVTVSGPGVANFELTPLIKEKP